MTNKVDWRIAPKDAQFYSAYCFRKHEDGVEYYWDEDVLTWKVGLQEQLKAHERYFDFESRPTLDDSNCNTYNPDDTPDYDESLDDKWDSGELGQSEDSVVVGKPECSAKASEALKELVGRKKEPTPIKSDGGSSSYYDIPIPDWLIDLIVERRYVKTEELIEVMGSDFDLGNIIKCAVRINSLKNGVGKAGNDVSYDANKIVYSANRLKERDKR